MQSTWILDSLTPRLPAPVHVLGSPQIAPSPYGPALHFNGSSDGLIIDTNPLLGIEAFTIESLFCPDADGPAEQRFVHVNDDTADARALLETRLTGSHFYADTFIRSAPLELPLNDPRLLHPCNHWHTLALVYDGTTMRQYLNGKLELQGQIPHRPFGPGRVSIACRINQIFWYKGLIRTVRFTSHPLPETQLLLP